MTPRRIELVGRLRAISPRVLSKVDPKAAREGGKLMQILCDARKRIEQGRYDAAEDLLARLERACGGEGGSDA